jgi:3-hydroxyacyl-CoA dehydrogenase/enoyl-CoA hydratase/3-hydroxybutyryl-CoA epimerase
MMGAGIAYVTANAGMHVVLKDVTQESADKGKAYSAGILGKKLSKKHLSQEKHDEILGRIHATADANDLKDCDLVIEAVFEDRDLKAKVTQEAEAVMNPNGVFASNTSTLPITGLAEASARPANFIGLHFFSPVDKMPLVEIIMGKETSQKALAWAIDYVKAIKKTPIVVQDGRGFYTSRVFATYVQEGIALLEEGVPAALIENAGKGAGMPVGPLALADEVSLSLLHHIVTQTEKDLGIKIDTAAARVGRKFVEELKRPGKKAEAGFYEYPKGDKKFLWPELKNLYPEQPNHADYETCKKRMLHIQAIEAVKCMEEGIVSQAKDADVGSILGWGFAPYTGGVISYIDYVGIQKFVAECDQFADQYGERFRPTDKLREMAKAGKGFYVG